MQMKQSAAFLLFVMIALGAAQASNESLKHREWTVDGVKREAVVYLPTEAKEPAPLVFVYHGHGGTSERAINMFRMHKLWPEAIVVYPQGLNTPGRLTDPKGEKPGWQKNIGDQSDRDLKFFDIMLESIRNEQKVDDARIYVTGHSNGGSFTYLLLAARGDTFAAIAPSGALEPKDIEAMKPKPLFHTAGSKDPLVKFEWQKQMIDAMLRKNECGSEGTKEGQWMTTYSSKINAPVITYIFDGGHALPREVPPQIVKFFKTQTKPTTQPAQK